MKTGFSSLAIASAFALMIGGAASAANGPAPAAGDGGITLNAATNAEPGSLDLQIARDPPAAFVTLQNVFEMPWSYDADGKLKETVAAITESADKKTITMKIHPGVKFQSGDELVAADVVFSWDRYKRRSRWSSRHAAFIDKVEATDKYTVRFTFKKPDVAYFNGGGVYLESKAYHERVGDKEFSAHPKGIGPYEIVGYKPGQYLDLKRFDGYYGKKPEVKSARIYFIGDDNTRIAKLKAGEVGLITAPPYPQIKPLEAAGYNIASVPAHPTICVQFNTWNPSTPWYKPKVRLAIAHAIDTNAIVNGLLDGFPKHYGFLAPGEFGYDPSIKPYSYDPKLAKKLLAEAGYPNGFKMPLYYTSAAYYGIAQTVEAVVLYLKQVGIQADVKGMDQSSILQLLFKVNGHKDANYVGVTAMPVANVGLDTLDTLTLAFWNNPASKYKPAWHNDQFDKLVNEARDTVNDEKRAEIVRKAIKILHADVGVDPLWDSLYTYAMSKDLHYQVIKHRLPALLLANVTSAAK